MNKCILIGNLTKDPELRTTGSGISVCSFSIGVSRKFANQNGERETDFFNIVAWRKPAEICAKYLRKGSQICVSGSMQNRSYEGNDGTKRYITELVLEDFQFLGGKRENSDSDTYSKPKNAPKSASQMHEIEEDMPF